MNPKDPCKMTDDDLLEEIVDTVRAGRSHGQWDRKRLRSISTEAQKRGLIQSKTTSELHLNHP